MTGVKHTFVSAITDSTDTTIVRPVDWNNTHTIQSVTVVGTSTDASGGSTLLRASVSSTAVSASRVSILDNGNIFIDADVNTGTYPVYANYNGGLAWYADYAGRFRVCSGGEFNVNNESILGSSRLTLNTNTICVAESSGVLALRNGTTQAQDLNVYNTYTDSSNYERFTASWQTTSNTLILGTQKAGTGTLRGVRFDSAGFTFNPAADTAEVVTVTNFSGASAMNWNSGGFSKIVISADSGVMQKSGGFLVWANGNSAYGTQDTRIRRSAAGILDIDSGTNSDWRNLRASNLDDRVKFFPADNEPPTSNYATLDTRNSHPVLDFDDTTAEAAIWSGVMNRSFSGAAQGLTVEVAFTNTSSSTGSVGWTAEFERIGDGSLDTDADSFGTALTITAVTIPSTVGYTKYVSAATASTAVISGILAGEQYRLRIKRDVANDNATGDAELHWASVRPT